jgi:hypothetical protein
MVSTALVGRGQQVVSLLLTTIPLAERMLLYNFAVTALLFLDGAKNPGIPQS